MPRGSAVVLGSHGDWDNLSLILGDEEVSVHCEHACYYDTCVDGFLPGFGPPYYIIVTEGTPFATAHASWAIPAWIIARLVQPDG